MKRVFLILTVIILSISFYPVKALEKASDILKKNVVTTGDGLYVDLTENERYIYKGGNPNNFIKFNDELWRIISVEKDGSLKIIRANVLDEKLPFNESSLDNGSYCSKLRDDGYGCNVWAKMDYFKDGHKMDYNQNKYVDYEGSVNMDSDLNTYLNNDYYSNLNQTSKNMIINYDFGIGSYDDDYNDEYWSNLYSYHYNLEYSREMLEKYNKDSNCKEWMSIGGIWNYHSCKMAAEEYTKRAEEYKAKIKDIDKDNIILDTMNKYKASENEYVWNGKIALANVSDVILANTNENSCRNIRDYRDYNYYSIGVDGTIKNECDGGISSPFKEDCFNKCADTNWLMPSKKYKFTDYNYLLLNSPGNNGGYTGDIYAAAYQGLAFQNVKDNYDADYNHTYYIRPVLYLNSNITIESGNGSENDPYVILYNESLADDNQNEDNSSLIVNVPSTSMFISIFVIGGFILIIIICLCIYLKVFKKKDIK